MRSLCCALTMRSLPGLPSSPRHSVAPVGRRMLDGSESSSRVISTTPAVSSSRQMPSTSSATVGPSGSGSGSGSAGTPVERLIEFMRERCPEAVLEEVEPPSLTFTVPTGASALSRLFGQLAEAQAGLHVSECSVTQCTLEQIFLLMASKSSLRNNAASEEQLA